MNGQEATATEVSAAAAAAEGALMSVYADWIELHVRHRLQLRMMREVAAFVTAVEAGQATPSRVFLAGAARACERVGLTREAARLRELQGR